MGAFFMQPRGFLFFCLEFSYIIGTFYIGSRWSDIIIYIKLVSKICRRCGYGRK